MAQQLPNGKQQFLDGNGAPLASGTVAFYLPGTLTPTNTWQDSALTILNANPLTLDANGEATIWGADSTQYRQIVKDSLGNTIWDETVGSNFTVSNAGVAFVAQPNTFTAANTFSGNNNAFTGTGNSFSNPVSVPTAAAIGQAVNLGQLNSVQSTLQAQITLEYPTITASVSANALTIGISAPAANSPSSLEFRNPSLANGAPVAVTLGSALSLTVPSGATLGTVSGQTARLYFALAYNGGTPVLCVCNGFIDETALQSPTTISGTSNSANVIYSAAAVSANSPIRVIGFVDINEATAGIWATAPTIVQGAGGAALYGMGGIGNGQTWQNMTSSRSAGSTYYNTTGRTITVCVGITVNNGGSAIPTVNGTALPQFGGDANGGQIGVGLSFPVPIGASYSLSLASASLVSNGWFELR